jgi:hypothetical protein
MPIELVHVPVPPTVTTVMNVFVYTCSECGRAYRVRVERSEPCDHDTPCCHHDEEAVDASGE